MSYAFATMTTGRESFEKPVRTYVGTEIGKKKPMRVLFKVIIYLQTNNKTVWVGNFVCLGKMCKTAGLGGA